MPRIPIRCDWPRFAPSVEVVTIDYDPPPQGRYTALTLEVRDFEGTVVHRTTREIAEHDPLPALRWDGRLDRNVDLAVEPWATPLRSPYTISVDAVIEAELEPPPQQPPEIGLEPVGSGQVVGCGLPLEEAPPPLVEDGPPPVEEEEPPPPPTEIELRVEYHSLRIVRGPWNATGQVHPADSDADVCSRLDELGYYAGPPAHVATDATRLARAKERFRRNCGDLRNNANPNNGDLVVALTAAAATPRPTLTDHAGTELAVDAALPGDDGPPLRVHVEAIGWQVDLANDVDEFNAQYDAHAPTNKTTIEQGRLCRPLVPLEAVIDLKDHTGARCPAPEAVGAVRIDWSFTEPAEDLGALPQGVHSKTRSYIDKVLEMTAGEGPRARNCPTLHGGVRRDQHQHRTAFWTEAASYAPYAPAQIDDAAACVHVPAHVDRAVPARVGRAGVYFHPSLIAGDRYRIQAAVDFVGRPNADALRLAHADVELRAETRTIEVWRRTEVLAVLGWPPRDDAAAIRDGVRDAYRRAYVELDFTHTRFEPADQILQDGDIVAWMGYLRGLSQATVDRVQNVVDLAHVHADSPVHLLQPAADLEPEQQLAVYMFMANMFSELRQGQNPSSFEFLTERIERRLRTGHPAGGLIFIDYAFTEEVRELVTAMQLDIPTLSVGNSDLNGLVDQRVPGARYFVFAHEIGHCFWLRHHENAPANTVARGDHDPHDHNCMMSYTSEDGPRPHQRAAAYAPQFCGKCNLKLRGWNITEGELLVREAADELDILFFYDLADPGLRADEEQASIEASVTRISRTRLRVSGFDANADFAQWCAMVSGVHVYHHVSHGNQRCSRHHKRVPTLELATPRYPVQCREARGPRPSLFTQGPLLAPALVAAEEELVNDDPPFDRVRLEQWARDNLVRPGDRHHPMHGVIQWTNELDDSSQDTEFTYEQIQAAINGHQLVVPRDLAFFSCCLIGWEAGFARLFLDAGTRYVIAFRSRYETAQALRCSQRFYEEWSRLNLQAPAIPTAFALAGAQYPHAEPVLFAADRVLRYYPASMANGSGQLVQCAWDDLDPLYEPHFPQR